MREAWTIPVLLNWSQVATPVLMSTLLIYLGCMLEKIPSSFFDWLWIRHDVLIKKKKKATRTAKTRNLMPTAAAQMEIISGKHNSNLSQVTLLLQNSIEKYQRLQRSLSSCSGEIQNQINRKDWKDQEKEENFSADYIKVVTSHHIRGISTWKKYYGHHFVVPTMPKPAITFYKFVSGCHFMPHPTLEHFAKR